MSETAKQQVDNECLNCGIVFPDGVVRSLCPTCRCLPKLNGIQEVIEAVIPAAPPAKVYTCPKCGVEHDGTKNGRTISRYCGPCLREMRNTGNKITGSRKSIARARKVLEAAGELPDNKDTVMIEPFMEKITIADLQASFPEIKIEMTPKPEIKPKPEILTIDMTAHRDVYMALFRDAYDQERDIDKHVRWLLRKLVRDGRVELEESPNVDET